MDVEPRISAHILSNIRCGIQLVFKAHLLKRQMHDIRLIHKQNTDLKAQHYAT